jgi:hypothetical protein
LKNSYRLVKLNHRDWESPIFYAKIRSTFSPIRPNLSQALSEPTYIFPPLCVPLIA